MLVNILEFQSSKSLNVIIILGFNLYRSILNINLHMNQCLRIKNYIKSKAEYIILDYRFLDSWENKLCLSYIPILSFNI